MTQTATASNSQLISRKEAADLLGISVRTIDRYIDKKLLNCKQKGRNVFLYEEEIQRLANEKIEVESIEDSEIHLDIDNNEAFLNESSKTSDAAIVADSSIMNFDFKKEAAVYKELYIDLKDDLKDAQKRLESANYRVGQLETQIKNTVPMIELSKKENEMDKKEADLREENIKKEQSIEVLEHQVQREKTLKLVLLGLLTILLLIEPTLLLIEYLISRSII